MGFTILPITAHATPQQRLTFQTPAMLHYPIHSHIPTTAIPHTQHHGVFRPLLPNAVIGSPDAQADR
jgi:hypothetical protein